jgi:uncharacterized membrane protein HdeD (DUF308 family)
MGSVLLLLGSAGLLMVATLTLASTLWYGVLLLVAGAAEIVEALADPGQHEDRRARVIRFLAGLLYLVGGFFAVFRPLEASLALTLVLGATLIASGVARAIWAVAQETQTSRAAMVLCALVSVLLGGFIVAQWPYSGLWAIGLFVSCELLAAGLAWFWVGLFGEPEVSATAPRSRIGAAR